LRLQEILVPKLLLGNRFARQAPLGTTYRTA